LGNLSGLAFFSSHFRTEKPVPTFSENIHSITAIKVSNLSGLAFFSSHFRTEKPVPTFSENIHPIITTKFTVEPLRRDMDLLIAKLAEYYRI